MHEKKYNLGWTDKLKDTQIYIYKGGNPIKEFTEKIIKGFTGAVL